MQGDVVTYISLARERIDTLLREAEHERVIFRLQPGCGRANDRARSQDRSTWLAGLRERRARRRTADPCAGPGGRRVTATPARLLKAGEMAP